jgi:hypothetical protein
MPSNAKMVARLRFRKLIVEFLIEAAEYLNEDETRLIRRLEGSSEASAIFGQIDDDKNVKRLFILCVEADCLFRTFEDRIREARDKQRKLDKYAEALVEIRRFLDDIDRPPRDRIEAFANPDPEEIRSERSALASVGGRIQQQKRIAAETPARLGATRKSHGRKAAETAAIGWIAEGVERITGHTNARLCADLAELVIEGDVSLDRVDNAAETRQREWRAPLGDF